MASKQPLPTGWSNPRFGELVTLKNGAAFNARVWGKTGLPIIRIQNLNGSPEFNYFDGAVDERIIINPGDMVFSWSGNRGTSFGPFVWRGARGVLNQHIFKVTVRDSVEQAFLYHALRRITAQIEEQAHGISGLVHVRKSELEGFRVLLPPEQERRRISEILDAIDTAIERTRAVIEQVRVVKQALLADLMTNGLPGRHKKFKKVKRVGRIPVAWRCDQIGNLFEVKLGKMLSEKSKQGVAPRPYLGNSNVQWGRFDLTSVLTMDFLGDEVERFSLRAGDILVCEGGEVGRTAIWDDEIPGCCYQKALHRLRPKDSNVLPRFFYYFMHYACQHNLFRGVALTSTISHLTRETLVKLRIPLPEVNEQEIAADVLSVVDARIQAEENTYQQLSSIKSALSDALLIGRIRVIKENRK